MTGIALLDTIIYIAIVIFILMFMITIHELGHYLAAKMLNFRVNEFAIGFGKPIFKRVNKKTGEVFSIRWLPLGGFCAFAGDEAAAGEGGSREDAKKREEEGGVVPKGELFQNTAPWKRLIVLFAGGFFNFICAILFAVVLMMIVGYHHNVRFAEVRADSPNAPLFANVRSIHAAGTSADDMQKFTLLTSIDTILVNVAEGEEIWLHVVYNDGTVNEAKGGFVLYRPEPNARLILGLDGRYQVAEPLSFFPAIGYATLFCFEVAWMLLTFLFLLITGQMGLFGNVGGPTATVSIMYEMVSINVLRSIFILVPLISVNLALFNLLPIPALDGARMVFVTIEWIRKKPVNPIIEGRIHLFGMIALLAFVIIADIGYWIVTSNLNIYLLNCSFLL
jgi:regulator of sigma E protease